MPRKKRETFAVETNVDGVHCVITADDRNTLASIVGCLLIARGVLASGRFQSAMLNVASADEETVDALTHLAIGMHMVGGARWTQEEEGGEIFLRPMRKTTASLRALERTEDVNTALIESLMDAIVAHDTDRPLTNQPITKGA